MTVLGAERTAITGHFNWLNALVTVGTVALDRFTRIISGLQRWTICHCNAVPAIADEAPATRDGAITMTRIFAFSTSRFLTVFQVRKFPSSPPCVSAPVMV